MVGVKLIGLAGTNGSGKDTVGYLIAEKHNFLFVSVSDLLRVECRNRGLPVERQNLRAISSEWRRDFGLGVLVDKSIELAKNATHKYDGVVACPMRNVGEAKHLKDLGGTLIWVDADQTLRYERIQAANRGRHGEDNKTFEEFVAEEHEEMYPSSSNDPSQLNGAGVRDMADAVVINESDLESLQIATEAALGI